MSWVIRGVRVEARGNGHGHDQEQRGGHVRDRVIYSLTTKKQRTWNWENTYTIDIAKAALIFNGKSKGEQREYIKGGGEELRGTKNGGTAKERAREPGNRINGPLSKNGRVPQIDQITGYRTRGGVRNQAPRNNET